MEKNISLDKIQMRVVLTADSGEVNTETLFEFTQNDSIISAKYAGGRVRLGYLVGKIIGTKVNFRYAQIDIEGRIDSGHSVCEVSQTAAGQISLLEHFQWDSREGEGINLFEEITYT